MRIAVCDDEQLCLSQIRTIAEEFEKTHSNRGIRFDFFSRPGDLLAAVGKTGGYDIYILDVIMPELNGIELGLRLREAGFDGKIVYLTSSQEYSLDAFRVRAFDYLIKPITKDAFHKTVTDAIATIAEKKEKTLMVKAKEKTVKLSFDSIEFITIDKRALCYHLTDGRCVESVTLRGSFADAIAQLLADRRFAHAGQSTAINLDHIAEIGNEAIVFESGNQTFLGEKNCRKLRGVWSKYLFDEEGTL